MVFLTVKIEFKYPTDMPPKTTVRKLSLLFFLLLMRKDTKPEELWFLQNLLFMTWSSYFV